MLQDGGLLEGQKTGQSQGVTFKQVLNDIESMGPREGRLGFRSNTESAVDAPSTVNVKLLLHTAWRHIEMSAEPV